MLQPSAFILVMQRVQFTQSSLLYNNLLLLLQRWPPPTTPGDMMQAEAVIPVQCEYPRCVYMHKSVFTTLHVGLVQRNLEGVSGKVEQRHEDGFHAQTYETNLKVLPNRSLRKLILRKSNPQNLTMWSSTVYSWSETPAKNVRELTAPLQSSGSAGVNVVKRLLKWLKMM